MSESNGNGKCPFTGGSTTKFGTVTNQTWWPNQLNIKILHQNSNMTDPMDPDFDLLGNFLYKPKYVTIFVQPVLSPKLKI